jgi:hypothetical protein
VPYCQFGKRCKSLVGKGLGPAIDWTRRQTNSFEAYPAMIAQREYAVLTKPNDRSVLDPGRTSAGHLSEGAV